MAKVATLPRSLAERMKSFSYSWAQYRRKSIAVPRTAEIPRPPADDRDSDHGTQAIGLEGSLRLEPALGSRCGRRRFRRPCLLFFDDVEAERRGSNIVGRRR